MTHRPLQDKNPFYYASYNGKTSRNRHGIKGSGMISPGNDTLITLMVISSRVCKLRCKISDMSVFISLTKQREKYKNQGYQKTEEVILLRRYKSSYKTQTYITKKTYSYPLNQLVKPLCKPRHLSPVSYTHLTLPTIYSV